jgi:glycosyltransferase involved in cell wall biosynthesis
MSGPVKSYSTVQTPPIHAGLLHAPKDLVGILYPGYGIEKVTYGLPVPGFTFATVKAIPFHRLLDRHGTFWAQTPFILDRSIPLIHTFNALPVNSKKFVVTFEMELPRYLGRCSAAQMKIGWHILNSERCRAILAMSEAARRFFETRLAQTGNQGLAKKLSVFRGGINPGPGVGLERTINEHAALQILFVGADGRRKGLVPLLAALKELRNGGVETKLTVVSEVSDSTYVFPDDLYPATRLRTELQELDWIQYHPYLPNHKVKQLMRRSDVFILPTLDESLGWTLIEAGMEGVPTFSTNVFAIPEILNDNVGGKVIPLELNRDRRWNGIYLNDDGKRNAAIHAFDEIQHKLIEFLNHAHLNRQALWTWGRDARIHLAKLYDPWTSAVALEKIYRQALA